MRVEVIVPFTASTLERVQLLAWVIDRHRRAGRDVTIGEAAPDGPWVKAAAVNPAVAASTADVVVVADADVWCDGLDAAITAVQAGAAWAVPHHRVMRLTAASTAAVLAGADHRDAGAMRLAERPYPGVAGGGLVVARRDVLEEVPLDARFVGWGREDQAWGAALSVLHGKPWRGIEPLLHLWHRPQERPSRSRGCTTSERLWRRYQAARTPAAMRTVIGEARQLVAA